MSLTNKITTAITSRMWMKPPMVALVTNPSSQRTRSMIEMVINIYLKPFRLIVYLPPMNVMLT